MDFAILMEKLDSTRGAIAQHERELIGLKAHAGVLQAMLEEYINIPHPYVASDQFPRTQQAQRAPQAQQAQRAPQAQQAQRAPQAQQAQRAPQAPQAPQAQRAPQAQQAQRAPQAQQAPQAPQAQRTQRAPQTSQTSQAQLALQTSRDKCMNAAMRRREEAHVRGQPKVRSGILTQQECLPEHRPSHSFPARLGGVASFQDTSFVETDALAQKALMEEASRRLAERLVEEEEASRRLVAALVAEDELLFLHTGGVGFWI